MRLWVKCLLIGAGVAALALALLPWWLGLVLPLAARPLHAEYRDYRRLGYARFALDGVTYRKGEVTITAEQVASDTPLVWLWEHWHRGDTPVTVTRWALVVKPLATPRAPVHATGMTPLYHTLVRLAARLDQWLPRASLKDGSVTWPTGGFRLADAEWYRGLLAFSGLRWKAGEASGRASFASPSAIQLIAEEPDRGWRSQATWAAETVDGRAWVKGQAIDFHGRYGAAGWMPEDASAAAPAWTFPTTTALSSYVRVDGSGAAQWRAGSFSIQIHARGIPRGRSAPPLDVAVAASGTRREWSIQALRVRSRVATVTLNRPISFDYPLRPRFSRAEIDVDADLSAWPAAGLQGRLGAKVAIAGESGPSSGLRQIPPISATLTLTGARWRGWTVTSGVAAARWADGRLTVDRLDLRLPDGEVSGSGAYDARTREIRNLAARAELSRAGLARFLPAGVSAASASIRVEASGPWPDVSHQGAFALADLKASDCAPVSVAGTWRGRGEAADRLQLVATASGDRLTVTGAAQREGATISAASLSLGGAGSWRLAGPVGIGWEAGRFQLGELRLTGPGASAVSVELGRGPAMRVQLTEFPTDWLRALVPWRGPDIYVRALDFSGGWEGGRLRCSGSFTTLVRAGAAAADVSASVSGDPQGFDVRALRVSQGRVLLASMDGRFPIWVNRAGARRLGWDPEGRLRFRADTGPRSPFWRDVANRFGLDVEEPEAHITLSGTLRRPVGRLQIGVGRIGPAPGRLKIRVPPIEHLAITVEATRAGLRLERLAGSIAGQAITAEGSLPVPAGGWRAWQGRPLGLLRHASGELTLAEGDLAPWAALFPQVLSPRGEMGMSVRFANGALSGAVHVREAALRPISGIGLVEGINLDAVLDGRTARIEKLEAEVGGQPLLVHGVAHLPAHGPPEFALAITGHDIPLIREPGAIVRSDVDLVAETQSGHETRVSGAVRVTDGIVLSDLGALLPSGPAGAPKPPPYFSIGIAPFADWTLDVHLIAQHTLRVHTTVYTGTQSADFHLVGTLADPRAIGQVTVDHGQVSLPFATFDVQFGAVRLTEADPFEPQVAVTASGRAYDFDLHLDVHGPIDAPIITFTSNPPLPSDQVLTLVMAGQLPPTAGVAANSPSAVAGLGAYLGSGLFSGLTGSTGSSRLEITSGQDISLSGKPTYEIDYRLTPRWWLVGEYDQFDNYDASVKWRVLSQGGKR